MHSRRVPLSCSALLVFILAATAASSATLDLSFRGADRYALIVGGWYEDGTPHGGLYWNVTKGFYEVLRERYGFWDEDLYFLVHKDGHNDSRVDAFSTRANIQTAINNIAARAKPQDTVVFFFVGHGGPFNFAASDAGMSPMELNNWAAGIKSEHQLWTFSQCGSGNFPAICAKPGRTVFSSCQADEGNAMPWAEAVRDAFKYASGADADGNGLVSFGEAHNFARQRQINHYGGESKLKEHSQFCDCGCRTPTTGMLPRGNHGQVALKETLGHEFGQIQTWSGAASDGQRFTYPRPFSGKAVVVCSAQKDGKPIAACAVDNTQTGFVLSLHDKPGQRVTGANASWVAFLPNGHRQLQAGCQWIRNSKVKIGFQKSFVPLPVVVCNAQRDGAALVAGATRFDRGSFDVQVTDLTGRPVNGSWLLWIAADPRIQRPSVEISGGYMANYPHSGVRTMWDPVAARSEVIMASAAWEDGGRRAQARSAQGDQVQLTVMMPPGGYAAPAWYTHYLSFRLNPTITLAPTAPLRATPALRTGDSTARDDKPTIKLPARLPPPRRR